MRAAAVIAGLYLLVWCSCSTPPATAGGSTDTGNARVVAVYADGSPAGGALVRLRTTGYTADTMNATAKSRRAILDARTDSHGRVTIDSMDPGEYTIEINDESGNTGMLGCAVSAGTTIVERDTLTVRPAAVVGGRATPGAYVQVLGLERIVRVDTGGTFTISDLPAGSHTIRVVRPDDTVSTLHDIAAGSGDTVSVPYAAWKYHSRAYINTGPDGAAISEELHGFPLLLRIATGGFQGDTADIRFSSGRGAPLAFEIEEWRGEDDTAAIWVRVDTIFAGNDSQYILMHWGNPAAADRSNSAAVFERGEGFSGVWHLTDTMFADATANRNDATAVNGPGVQAGLAGGAARFTGGAYLDCGPDTSLNLTTRLTISAWMKLDEPAGNRFHVLANNKSAWGSAEGFDFVVNPGAHATGDQGVIHFYGRDSSVANAYPVWDDEWHHVAVTVRDSLAAIYFDGVAMIDGADVTPLVRSISSLAIAGTPRGGGLEGFMDEMRVESVARSHEWIKLCHATQRPGQATVTIERPAGQ